MNLKQLQALAHHYGYTLKDISTQYPYNQRKGKTWGIVDRRSGMIAATYSDNNRQKIEEFFSRFAAGDDLHQKNV